MASFLIKNIKQLAGIRDESKPLRGSDLAQLHSIEDGYVLIEDEEITAFGSMRDLGKAGKLPKEQLDATGRFVLPAWCDSHTHLVFAGSREMEFVDKIKGLSYAEIAAKGGGILNSAKKLRNTSDDDLYLQAKERIAEATRMGTANFEIKSGYGLTLEDEIRMLRVVKRLKDNCIATIRSTFLGAHAFPEEYKENKDGYVQLIIEKMIPAISDEKLADYIDVFCEQGFFDVQQTEKICAAGAAHGMRPKIHANQLSASGAVQAGIRMLALSVDHLEVMDTDATQELANSLTIGTLLPTAAFFLRAPFQPARSLINAGCAIALASDCNPGSSPGLNMNFVVSLACIAMKMLPEEAVNAATFNAACALELQHQTGSIAVGKKADLIVTKPISSLAYIPYSFASIQVEKTIIKGQLNIFKDETF